MCMKKFLCFSPRQGENSLTKQVYEAIDNTALRYGETRFPIIPVIAGYALPGEEIRVIAVTEDYPNSIHNLSLLEDAVNEVIKEKALKCSGVERISVAYDDSVTSQLDVFQKLIDVIEDDDELYACITYGSKPSPLVELMALRYARVAKKNTIVRCVVYGQKNHITKEAKIYDVTALVQLDDIVRVLAQLGSKNIGEAIRNILAL